MTSKAVVIGDTFNPSVITSRITTFEVYAPRFLLAELNTHRVLSRSAASSRAIPVLKRVEMVRQDPWIPSVFGKNKPGMSADEELSDAESVAAEDVWRGAITAQLLAAEELAKLGVHKQLANRLLEPYAHFYGVVTATELDNFWKLRVSPAAQPEFKELATAMQEALYDSKPRDAKWNCNHHLPYNPDYGLDLEVALRVCSARCARVSYKSFDGKLSTAVEDIKLCERLIAEGHLSPFDHCAFADDVVKKQAGILRVQKNYWTRPEDHRQFWGFIPYRVQVEKDLGMVCRRSSFDAIDDDLVAHAS